MKNLTLKAFPLAFALALGGCGSSSDDNGAVVEDPESNLPDTSPVKTITAIDGYLENAQVSVDTNNNFIYDEEDLVLGRTNTQGKYDVPADYSQSILFVTAIANETIDTSRGLVTSSFSLGMTGEDTIASPITNLVVELLRKDPSLEVSVAKTLVIESLQDIDESSDLIFTDYLAIDSEVAVAITILGEILVDHHDLTTEQKIQAATVLSDNLQNEIENSDEELVTSYYPSLNIPDDPTQDITVQSNYRPAISKASKDELQAEISEWELYENQYIDYIIDFSQLFESKDDLTYSTSSSLTIDESGEKTDFDMTIHERSLTFNAAPSRQAEAGAETITISATDGVNIVKATFSLPVIHEATPQDNEDTSTVLIDPVDTIDPNDPLIVIVPEVSDPELPVDSDSVITNVGSELPYLLPLNPLNPLNPIVNKEPIVSNTSGTGVSTRHEDNTEPVMLFSKYKLEESESSIDIYTSTDFINGDYDIYNIDENLSADYFTTAERNVKDSFRNYIQPYFGLFSSAEFFIYNLHAGSNMVNCMVAIDYDNHINFATPLEILTAEEALSITSAQAEKSIPTKISSEVINKVLRVATLDNVLRKNDLTSDAIWKYEQYDGYFTDAESNNRLQDICHGDSVAYNQKMKSLVKISNTKVKMLEVEISQESKTTRAYQNRLVLTGLNLEEPTENKITLDIIHNVLIKNMILNRIFNWNGDGYSYLSKHSFINGEFTGLFEGIAAYQADQNFTHRSAASTCNPAKLTNGCSYPQVYADSALMVSYLLSSDTTLEQLNKEKKLVSFIKSLETYNAVGCDVEWDAVSHDQVQMSNSCIEKAFDATEFTKIDGSILTWNDLSTNWFTIRANLVENPFFTSGNKDREVLIFK